ncbi:MAG: protein-L-isoaspartate(D-aspartate) O-methyltransferase [Gammaproteobacteria bacterium]|nr:MAG: protein-L-isoaspartate(D-aspartate) O-methyltransferase [Gammaproteobacteria bacterium]TND04798.1 MAG: protein-L-isoaspartate(D-aspartate) O-methyltransferase [Gammaproteobacteria bacterium]
MNTRHLGIGMTSQRTRARLIERLRQEGIQNPAVLETIYNTPRHIFVDEALASRAYEDTALPIGHGQTISQPYIVARMTEVLLEGGPLAKVLEVGTGCGYQAAVLARLVDHVYTVERVDAMIAQARQRFQELGLRNIRVRHGDGKDGWAQYAPYDGIIVTAAPTEIPQSLLEQLAPNGRLIAPLGAAGQQQLTLFVRKADCIEKRELEAVSFVPLRTGVH